MIVGAAMVSFPVTLWILHHRRGPLTVAVPAMLGLLDPDGPPSSSLAMLPVPSLDAPSPLSGMVMQSLPL